MPSLTSPPPSRVFLGLLQAVARGALLECRADHLKGPNVRRPEEGFRTGEADRRDRWRSDYRDSYAYQDANYGYTGYYVDQDEYNYYFRQGFSRGYEDGFSSRNQYGSYSNCSYSVLGAILGQILDFQSLR